MWELYVFLRNLNHGEDLFPEINYSPPLKNLVFSEKKTLKKTRVAFIKAKCEK